MNIKQLIPKLIIQYNYRKKGGICTVRLFFCGKYLFIYIVSIFSDCFLKCVTVSGQASKGCERALCQRRHRYCRCTHHEQREIGLKQRIDDIHLYTQNRHIELRQQGEAETLGVHRHKAEEKRLWQE